MSKFARLQLLVRVVVKHLKSNAFTYLKLIGALLAALAILVWGSFVHAQSDASVYLCVDGHGKKQYVTGKDVREKWEPANCKKIDLPGLTAIPTPKASTKNKGKSGVSIGMTKADVLASSWGKPQRINKTTNAYGTHEQWVYGNGNYLYFENGLLTTIQN